MANLQEFNTVSINSLQRVGGLQQDISGKNLGVALKIAQNLWLMGSYLAESFNSLVQLEKNVPG